MGDGWDEVQKARGKDSVEIGGLYALLVDSGEALRMWVCWEVEPQIISLTSI